MHRPKVYRIVHRVHHDSIVPSPWTAFSFHPIESLLQALVLPVVVLFLPLHYLALSLILLVMTVSAAINHLDIEIYPRGFEKHWLGRWLIGATHHSLHHSRILKDGKSTEFQQLEEEQGFDFVKREKFADQDYNIKEFRLFRKKHARRLKGLISREVEKDKIKHRIYDYWTNNDMEESKTTVIELFHSGLRLSPFEIRPKRTIKWAKEIIGREPRIYEHLESFHSFYEIISENEARTASELNEVFLDLVSTKVKLRVEGEGHYLLVYYQNKQIPIARLMDEYNFALELQELLLSKAVSGEDFV